ncbi:VOC family protein [Flavihumibacter sp. CACIAM 22H1]|uniref:VOC family protein n=1 Tax=Flavihumibacter sp. CACIAM 22H1 TaxID=1812911 RepID=UPI0007A83B59|nr:VOC family protein [Flavihumibacter sp. CACIAM 22H1]KYP15766.1 MAG: bleomycin resistance protein [Flavihumibacter sp. CACIAM 22H1]
MSQHTISWFEIPTTDLERAQKFYETILAIKMVKLDMPNLSMRMFPVEDFNYIGGALVYAPDFYQPQASGTLVYLNANPDVQVVLDRVEEAGGSILIPKTEISPEHGFMAVILDTEGNRIALHSVPVQ